MKTFLHHTNSGLRHLVIRRSLQATTKFLLSTVLFSFLIPTANAQPTLENVTVPGFGVYDFTYVNDDYNDISMALQSQQWWGNSSYTTVFVNAIINADNNGTWASTAPNPLLLAYGTMYGEIWADSRAPVMSPHTSKRPR
jgi:hypothetical protein